MVNKKHDAADEVPEASVVTAEKPESLSSVMEKAMSAAITAASEEGITEPKEIQAKMLEAREKAKADYKAKQAAPPAEDSE